jgi:hypothetical protein
MKEKSLITQTLLQYPYINEIGDGCNAVVKRNDLYVKCGNQCNGSYCKICSFNLNLIDIKERVVGGFKNNKPNGYTKMICYKKTMKKMGESITTLKKKAKQLNLTLNMGFIEEMCKTKTKRRPKKKEKVDISIVSDSDEEDEPRVVRGRGRPKHVNNKNNSDLFNELLHGKEQCEDTDEESDDEEIIVEVFDYTGNQEEYRNMSLCKDENDIVYTISGDIIGSYYESRNEIINPLS